MHEMILAVIIAVIIVIIVSLHLAKANKEKLQCVPGATWHTLGEPRRGRIWDYPQTHIRAPPRCIAQFADRQMRTETTAIA